MSSRKTVDRYLDHGMKEGQLEREKVGRAYHYRPKNL